MKMLTHAESADLNFSTSDAVDLISVTTAFDVDDPLSQLCLEREERDREGGERVGGEDLALGWNNLGGTIPKQVLTLSSLLNLYLHDNHLVGSIQLEIGNLINLEQLDVSRNMLFGKIPSTLGSCVKLRFLYMQGNNFWGTLPSSLSYLRGIEELDLSHNNFSGKIPDYLEGFVFLQKLDLSFNDFEGVSFVAECEALRRIRHRNLVKVFTACSSVDYNGNDFKALVYEFMVNGSLEDWLHANENEDEVHVESRNLNLLQRLNIAVDVASALDYLHHHYSEPIVHCDLKPSNVLLNDEMIGHVHMTCNGSKQAVAVELIIFVVFVRSLKQTFNFSHLNVLFKKAMTCSGYFVIHSKTGSIVKDMTCNGLNKMMLPEMVASILSDSSRRQRVLSQCDASDVLRDAFLQTEASMNHYYEEL
ncbi:hypothetical protein ACSBR2_013399 [Camellia fascicularis]